MVTRMRSEPVRGDLSARPKTLRPGEKRGDQRFIRADLCGLLAHDLKTSLASISMNLDFVIAQLAPASGDGVSPALEDCRQANVRAIRIVSDMADAARLLVGDYRATLSDVCPGQLIERAAHRATDEAATRDIQVAFATDDTRVLADADLLSRVFDRLLDRALRHARAGTRLDIAQRHLNLSIRATTGSALDTELTEPNLTMYFTQAAMSALGGRAWTESENPDVLVYCVALPG